MGKLIFKETLEYNLSDLVLTGAKCIPYDAKEIVIFSHESSCCRSSPQLNYIAGLFNDENIATLIVDWLTPEEEFINSAGPFTDLLTKRLMEITIAISKLKITSELNIGYLGTGTGAASALNAASSLGPEYIKALVLTNGKTNLSLPVLDKVKSPVLLIAGELDTEVLKLNKVAFKKLKSEKKIEIVKGSSLHFEEPGKADIVAELAIDWFSHHLKIKNTIAPVGDLIYPYPWS